MLVCCVHEEYTIGIGVMSSEPLLSFKFSEDCSFLFIPLVLLVSFVSLLVVAIVIVVNW